VYIQSVCVFVLDRPRYMGEKGGRGDEERKMCVFVCVCACVLAGGPATLQHMKAHRCLLYVFEVSL